MGDYSVNAGDLQTLITFQTPTINKDGGGAQVGPWTNVSTNPTVWASWVNEHRVKGVISDAMISTQRAIVTRRSRGDVQPSWRIVKDGEYWQILSIDQVQDRKRWTELIVERVKGTV